MKPLEAGAFPLLSRIQHPADIRAYSMEELRQLAQEIRRAIIATVASNGGHLAPHLGVVEIAIALHYVFDAEHDKLIWDVGHQSYAHKLLTGRFSEFHTIRQRGGLCGYPRPDESPYDASIVGHSSTSISTALGMAIARDKKGEDHKVLAVIGDGSMTAGMAFEALAHAGHLEANMAVILNDNRMSIAPNAGAWGAYFGRLITAGLYTRARHDIDGLMKQWLSPQIHRAAQVVKHSVKGLLTPRGTVFEELGLKYVGPLDGHDLDTLIHCFENIRRIQGPVFLHCVTQKGRGCQYAEDDPETYHGVRAFNIETGEFLPVVPKPQDNGVSFTEVFGEAVLAAAQRDPRVVGITAAMAAGTGLSALAKTHPDRFYDVGICEQHAVTFAAGLASQGLRPICAIYSSFMQRAYDQFLHDVCIQGIPVVFGLDRAGAVGEDSPTHQGAYDLSFLRAVPGITLLAPRDEVDLRAMLDWALEAGKPVVLRYPKSAATLIGPEDGRPGITHAQVLREGNDAVILGLGPCLRACMTAAETLSTEGFNVGVVDTRCVKPLDEDMLRSLAGRPLLTVEENTLQGGFGSAILEFHQRAGLLSGLRMQSLGLPDRFMPHATRDQQLEEAGLDAPGIANALRGLLEKG